MPRKKRPFLNKKTALRFEVVSRSLDEAGYVAGEASEHILRPLNAAAAEAQWTAMMQRDAAEAPSEPEPEPKASGVEESKGLGDGVQFGVQTDVVIDASGAVMEATPDMIALPGEVFAAGDDLPPEMKSVSLAQHEVPQDVRDALEGCGDYEEVDGDDMPDDFIAMLGGMVDPDAPEELDGPHAGGGYDDEAEEFDIEAHMARLLAQAELEDAANAPKDELEEDEYAALARGSKAARRAEQKRGQTEAQNLVDEQLDAVLAQYDDEEIGELEDEEGFDEESNPVTDAILAGALDEFMDSQDMENNYLRVLDPENKTKDSTKPFPLSIAEKQAKAAKEGTVEAKGDDAAAEGEGSDDDSSSSDGEMEIMELQLPAAVRRATAHDVETVVSTYTTTDNHPTVIDTAITKIRLSSKTGFPVISARRARGKKGRAAAGAGESDADDVGEHGGAGAGADTVAAGGQGEVEARGDDGDGVAPLPPPIPMRKKGETKEEKRARKAAVKAQRKARREAKKLNKLQFKAETKKQKRSQQHGTQAAGQTVLFL